jgi:hypothetical protein
MGGSQGSMLARFRLLGDTYAENHSERPYKVAAKA